jgi:carbonic anhydrase
MKAGKTIRLHPWVYDFSTGLVKVLKPAEKRKPTLA